MSMPSPSSTFTSPSSTLSSPRQPVAPSAIGDAFDAEIDVAVAQIGLYLVVAADGASAAMHRSLAAVGGRIAAAVSTHRVLAVLDFAAFQTLRTDPVIALVGPVSLDPDRFRHFQQLVGIDPTDD